MVDNKPLEEHGKEIVTGRNGTDKWKDCSIYVVAESGKRWSLEVGVGHEDREGEAISDLRDGEFICWDIYVDGHCFDARARRTYGSHDDTGQAPTFVELDVQPKVDNVNTDLGLIFVKCIKKRLRPGTLQKCFPTPIPTSQPILDKDSVPTLKTQGSQFSAPTNTSYFSFEVDAILTLASFTFRYRSCLVLFAEGIIPPPSGVKRTPSSYDAGTREIITNIMEEQCRIAGNNVANKRAKRCSYGQWCCDHGVCDCGTVFVGGSTKQS